VPLSRRADESSLSDAADGGYAVSVFACGADNRTLTPYLPAAKHYQIEFLIYFNLFRARVRPLVRCRIADNGPLDQDSTAGRIRDPITVAVPVKRDGAGADTVMVGTAGSQRIVIGPRGVGQVGAG